MDRDDPAPVAGRGLARGKRTRRVLWITAATGLVGLAWLFSDATRARRGVFEIGKLRTPAEAEWSPDRKPAWHTVDSPETVASYRGDALEFAGEGSARQRATRLLTHVAELGSTGGLAELNARPSIDTDEPEQIYDALKSGSERGNCSHYSFAYENLAHAAGMSARVVGLEGDDWLDGRGHAMNEVYLPESQSWMLVDALNHAYFVDANGEPLSLLALREHLLSGRDDEVRVVQGGFYTGGRDASATLAYYKKWIERVIYNASDDLVRRRREIYDGFTGRALQLRSWPRPARRLAENTLWQNDHRMLYVDGPETDVLLFEPWVYRISASMFGGSLLLLAALAVAGKLSGRGR